MLDYTTGSCNQVLETRNTPGTVENPANVQHSKAVDLKVLVLYAEIPSWRQDCDNVQKMVTCIEKTDMK